MRLITVASLLVVASCGMMGRGQELAAPSASALTQEADGTETLRLTWAGPSITREYLEKTTVTSSGEWLAGTKVLSDRDLQLTFAHGFAQSMAGQGSYSVTLTMPDQSQMSACPCCRHSSHVVQVNLAFDPQGVMTNSAVTQVVR